MNYPSNHLYLMSSGDVHSRFWANGFGLAAENYRIIFANDFIGCHGIHGLFNKIENEIVNSDISLLFIEISSPIYDPFFIFYLKRKYGLMVVLLALDDEYKFDWLSSTYATTADLALTLDYISVNRYRQSGVNAHFFMHPIYIPEEVPTRKDLSNHVSFVGRVDEGKPSRMEFVRFLAGNGIKVSYFGSGDAKDPSYLSRDEMYSVYRHSAINLNFTGITTYLKYDNVLYKRIRGVKGRPLEIAAAGGFCISEFSISLAKSFEDGVDIVFFRTKAELLEKIQYFLCHQDEARKIAENGAKKIKEQFSCEAVAGKLKLLIQESQEHLGLDFYGEPHRVQVSRWLAYSFIGFTLSNSVSLFFKGKFRSVFNNFRTLTRFLRHLSADTGRLITLQVILIVVYRFGKEMLAKIRSMILPHLLSHSDASCRNRVIHS